LIGDASIVLLGEASHGTHDFYRERAVIAKRLVEKRGFSAVAVEADWPDAYRFNRYVDGASDDPDAERALAGFERFPTWMWRKAEVLDFVGWLRAHNECAEQPAGFYGLDLYSLFRSISAVIAYLDEIDPAAATLARKRYACFGGFEESQAYGYAGHAASRSPVAKQWCDSSSSCREAPPPTCAATASPRRTISSMPRRTLGWC
jgi:erythromycin esterase-like protein